MAVIYLPHSAESARRMLPLHGEAQTNCCSQEDVMVTHPTVAKALLLLFMKINLYQFRILWLLLWIRIWITLPSFLTVFSPGKAPCPGTKSSLPFDCQQMFFFIYSFIFDAALEFNLMNTRVRQRLLKWAARVGRSSCYCSISRLSVWLMTSGPPSSLLFCLPPQRASPFSLYLWFKSVEITLQTVSGVSFSCFLFHSCWNACHHNLGKLSAYN